jgi:hypothetical protein
MAAKKKTKHKKKTTSMTTARKKVTRVKRTAAKRGISKKTVKRKEARKKATSKKKFTGGRTAPKPGSASKGRVRRKIQTVNPAIPAQRRARALSGGQSGDLQGLSRSQGADSESVEELLEEGNAFEADVVSGVESADATDEKEVRTHEVLEDDVPEEYLDKD